MTPITVAQLTEATLEGNGVFDVLMKANKAHLEAEFAKGRIKGPEYATVYLGSLTQILQTALQFLLSKDKTSLEADLVAAQIALTEAQIEKLNKEVEVADSEILIAQKKVELAEAEVGIAEAKLVNIPKEGAVLDAQAAQVAQQTTNLTSQKAQIEAQTLLINEQKTNATKEFEVLHAQKCKLQAEFDLTMGSVTKVAKEADLLTQKIVTESAQTTDMGISDNSVLGRQKALYLAQATGFTRDAEQKAAKVLIDSWNVRRTTDPDATDANGTNALSDASIGRAVNKLLGGIGA